MQWNDLKNHLRHLSIEEQKRIQDAFDLGKKAHGEQKRKSGEPYFSHPIAVASLLADMGADADALIAALLHDTIEDTHLTLKEVQNKFNGDVTLLVDGVTKLTVEDFANSPTLDEQIETLRKMFLLLKQDVRIMVIKLVDRLHNMQTIDFLPEEKQKALAKETLDIYVKIADRLCLQEIRDALEALCYSILEPELSRDFLALRTQNKKDAMYVLRTMEKVTKENVPKDLKISLQFEQKSWKRLREQLRIGGNAATGISTHTIVFVVQNEDDCYRVLGLLHQKWQRETLSFQDFVNSPRINGYQGLHTTIIQENGTRIRCKIRTEEMHEYARKGIATKCFDSEAEGILSYLPWTKRISPLAKDTEARSEEFWQSLQSDILEDSIVVHGPGSETLLVPQGSTVLDAAFYLFNHHTLRAKTITLNGSPVEFGTKLTNAATIDMEVSRSHTVDRQWLDFAETGIAIAKIRSALEKRSEEQKLVAGKHLLQKLLTSKNKGFVEEFEQKSIQTALQSIGYNDLNEAYIALADGRIDTIDLYKTLFEKKKYRSKKTTNISNFQFSFPLGDLEIVSSLIGVFQKHRVHYKDLKMRYNPLNGIATATAQLDLTEKEKHQYFVDLEKSGATNVRIFSPANTTIGTVFILCTLLTLWGLDPVIAHLLLQELTAYNLTFIRFIIFFVCASLLFGAQKSVKGPKLKPLTPYQPTLIFSGIALFLTAIFSYLTLALTSATVYILFIILGVLMSTLYTNIRIGKKWFDVAISMLLIIVGIGIALNTETISSLAFLLATASSLSFSFYSAISRRYQSKVEAIHARYPAFLFWLSVSMLPLILLLFPFTTVTTLPLPLLIMAAGFILIFSILPYALYFECMKRTKQHTLERSLPFVALVALVGEMLIAQSWNVQLLLILGCVGLSIYVIQLRRTED